MLQSLLIDDDSTKQDQNRINQHTMASVENDSAGPDYGQVTGMSNGNMPNSGSGQPVQALSSERDTDIGDNTDQGPFYLPTRNPHLSFETAHNLFSSKGHQMGAAADVDNHSTSNGMMSNSRDQENNNNFNNNINQLQTELEHPSVSQPGAAATAGVNPATANGGGNGGGSPAGGGDLPLGEVLVRDLVKELQEAAGLNPEQVSRQGTAGA